MGECPVHVLVDFANCRCCSLLSQTRFQCRNQPGTASRQAVTCAADGQLRHSPDVTRTDRNGVVQCGAVVVCGGGVCGGGGDGVCV